MDDSRKLDLSFNPLVVTPGIFSAGEDNKSELDQITRFVKQKNFAGIFKNTVPPNYRTLMFGDLDKEFDDVKSTLVFTPYFANPREVMETIQFYSERLASAIRGHLQEMRLNLEDRDEEVLSKNLRETAKRRMKRNLTKLYEGKHLAPLRAEPSLRSQAENFRDKLELLMSQIDERSGTFGDEGDTTDLGDSGEWLNELTSESSSPKLSSFRALFEEVKRIRRVEQGPIDDQRRCLLAIEFMEKIMENSEDYSNGTLEDIMNSALDHAWKFLSKISADLEDAKNLVSEYGDLGVPAPKTYNNKLDLALRARTSYPQENLVRLMDPQTPIRDRYEIGIQLGIARSHIQVKGDPYVAASQKLTRSLGARIIHDKMFTEDVYDVHLDEEGNKVEASEDIFPFSVVEIEVDGTLHKMGLYFPNNAFRCKDEISTIEKLIRKPSCSPGDLYDLFAGKAMVDATTRELLGNGASLRVLEEIAKQLMERQGFSRRPNNKKRENLNPGEYIIKKKLVPNGDNRGFYPAVKIYFRTVATQETPRGVGGEFQLLPRDTSQRASNPNHPSHERFYRASKLVEIIRNIFNPTVFPELHEYVDYLDTCLNELARRFQEETGLSELSGNADEFLREGSEALNPSTKPEEDQSKPVRSELSAQRPAEA